MLTIIQDYFHKKDIVLIEIYIPSSTLYGIMSKQIKDVSAVFVFVLFCFLTSVSLRLGMGGSLFD